MKNNTQPVRLDQKLFRWYGLTTMGILLVLSTILVIALSMVVNRNAHTTLENTNRDILELVKYTVEYEIEEYLAEDLSAAFEKIHQIRREYKQLPEDQVQDKVRTYLQDLRIGKEGYIFAVNSNGIVLIHPFPSLVGTDLRDSEFVQKMITDKSGFLTYYWRNPDQAEPQFKVLSMRYIPDWDWIVAVTAYPSNFPQIIDKPHMQKIVLSREHSSALHSFVMDTEGNLLIHPHAADSDSSVPAEPGLSGAPLLKILEKKSGFTSYVSKEEINGYKQIKLLHFLHIPHLNWIVISGISMSEVRKPLWQVGLLLAFLNLLISAIFLALSARFSRSIHTNLDQLVMAVNKGVQGDYNHRVDNLGIHELDTLGEHINHFLDKLAKGEITQKNLWSLQMLSDTVFNNTLEGIAVTDTEGNITIVNEAFTQITGYSKEEALGRNPRILKSEHHDDEFYSDMWASIIEKGFWSGEIWNRHKSGKAYPEWLTITTINNSRGEPEQYISIFHDISDLKKNEERLKHMAYHDSMTGLPNRELFRDRLEVALASAHRSGNKGALIFLDLDNFKKINDSLGHSVGDIYLQEIARRLESTMREADTVARLGGDEFTILLPVISDQNDALDVIKRIQAALEEPVFFNKKILYPRASYGITFFPEDGTNPTRLMSNADMAMYRSKKRNEGGYTIFNKAIEKKTSRRNLLEERLRQAVVDGRLHVYYQPQYSLSEKHFSGVEALIRWNDPEEGWISPGEFIPIAERSGLIAPIDTWVLRTALKEIKTLNSTLNLPLMLSVNVSALQFNNTAFVDSIQSALKEADFPAGLLELEITEGTAMENLEEAIRKMEQLSEAGIHLAIDDFGTGYSSLSYLNRFRINTLKIDGSFIRELQNSSVASAITTSVISMGNSLGLKVIAEGVETAEQLDFVKKQSCPVIQGFYFARPMPAVDLAAFLISNPHGKQST